MIFIGLRIWNHTHFELIKPATRTRKNPCPWLRVRVSTGTGTGCSEKFQGSPSYSLFVHPLNFFLCWDQDLQDLSISHSSFTIKRELYNAVLGSFGPSQFKSFPYDVKWQYMWNMNWLQHYVIISTNLSAAYPVPWHNMVCSGPSAPCSVNHIIFL